MGKKYYKVLSSFENRCGYPYHTGFNDLTGHLDEEGEQMVCYFTDVEHIFAYLNYGPVVRSVTFPNNTIIKYDPEKMVKDGPDIPGWYSECVILGKPRIFNLKTIKKLIKDGADVNVDDGFLFKWAYFKEKEVWDYLSHKYIDNQLILTPSARETFLNLLCGF